MTERCEQHRAPAGWRCTACNACLCPDCTALQEAHPVQLVACTRCRGLAEPIRRHRLELGTFVRRLPGALLYPLRGDGLILALACTLLATGVSYLPPVFVVLPLSGAVAALFGVVRATGRGATNVDLDEFGDVLQGIALPLLRFATVTLPLWLPLGMYALVVGPANMSRVVVWFLAVVGVVWVPMSFIGAATNSRLLSLLNPLTMLGCAAKVGRDYGLYLAAWAVLAVLLVPLGLLSLALNALPIPVASRFAAIFVLLAPFFAGASVSGLVLYLYGDVLGWGAPDEYAEPVLGAATPRGVMPVVTATSPSVSAKYAPIELEPAPAPAAGGEPETPAHRRLEALDVAALPALPGPEDSGTPAPARVLDVAALPPLAVGAESGPIAPARALDPAALPQLPAAGGELSGPLSAPSVGLDADALPPLAAAPKESAPRRPLRELDAATLPSLETQLVARIRDAMREGDPDGAVDAWKALRERPAGLRCGELAWVGRAAAARNDDRNALEALEAAARSPGPPAELARARVLLARLLDERLRRADDARAWMERVVAEQDGTEGAAFARSWLAARPGSGG